MNSIIPTTKNNYSKHSHKRFFMISSFFYIIFLFVILVAPSVHSKEVVATNEWQILQEGETIPHGLHIRVDFETGQKWYKLMNDNDDNNENNQQDETIQKQHQLVVNVDSSMNTLQNDDKTTEKSHGVKITQINYADISAESKSKVASQLLNFKDGPTQEQILKNKKESIYKINDFKSDMHQNEKDYEMMFRTLSSLPQEEIERMGGLPPLPPSNQDDPSFSNDKLEDFIQKVKTIWNTRQDELKKLEEEIIADMPTIIQDRISFLESYISAPIPHLYLVLNKDGSDDITYPSNIIEVLEDLEYHLSDIDMARDFHIMGGWPLLVSLLSEPIHGLNSVSVPKRNITDSFDSEHLELQKQIDALQQVVRDVQSLTSWAIGTAVKNVQEFNSWALEDFSEFLDSQNDDNFVNAISMLLSHFGENANLTQNTTSLKFIKRAQKDLYALGCLIRGNRDAIHFFSAVEGPKRLIDYVNHINIQYSTEDGINSSIENDVIKIMSRILFLVDDIISDIKLHPADAVLEESSTDKDNPGSLSSKKLLDQHTLTSLTTEDWCSFPSQLLNNYRSINIQNQSLKTILTMFQYCPHDATLANRLTSIQAELLDSDEVSLHEKQIFEEYAKQLYNIISTSD